jgi:flavin-dependent dehydrogenase
MSTAATTSRYDVIIMGGGLAGLCLSLQLKQRLPDLRILVVERRPHPVPEAIHKIGESSVEIAAHYFDTVLGLKDHLDSKQLRKFGFRFFFSDARTDIDRVTEVGASRYLSTPSYQIDRGIFENFLGETVRQHAIEFVDDALIRKFELNVDGNDHTVAYFRAGQECVATGRWLIDATGRASLIKRRLQLEKENDHNANAVWFRIGSRIRVDDWSACPQWQARCTPPDRWLSTNHLVGPGYWAWLIPLSSGSHSIGIVADSTIHPSSSLDSFEKVLDWLDQHQPRLAQAVREEQHHLQDFAYLRRVSYSCKQLFSGKRWALTGESGVFLDPFYSPGSDFIAISNTYITDLVAKDHDGAGVGKLARVYERFFMSFYDSTLALYQNQYQMFGNSTVFPLKIVWDYTYYWGILCQLFFQNRLTDISTLGKVSAELEACKALNFEVQDFLRTWTRSEAGTNAPVMLDHAGLQWFAELNRGLRDELDDAAFVRRIRQSAQWLHQLALEIIDIAHAKCPDLDDAKIRSFVSPETGARTAPPMLAAMLKPDTHSPAAPARASSGR